MSGEEIEKRWNLIGVIIKNLTRNQIKTLLTQIFEIDEMPNVIAVNRKSRKIEGFVMLKKKMLRYEIQFFALEPIDEIIVSLGQGYLKIQLIEKIVIEEKGNCIEVYLKNNKQYLFSVFL